MMKKITLLKLVSLVMLGSMAMGTQAIAREVRNDMPFICKYEAKRNYGVTQNSVQTLPVEKARNGFVVYGQSPRNTNRALFFQCKYDRRGNYIGIKKTSDKRYSGDGQANHRIPKTVRRVCKGEASSRWRMRPNDIRISRTKKLGRNDYMVNLSARNYRGKCEVSGSGHIYQFRTSYANNNANNVAPREAVRSCKRRAMSRWGVRADRIRTVRTRRLGRDDYNVKLSFRDYRADCEVSGRGRIYLFSEH